MLNPINTMVSTSESQIERDIGYELSPSNKVLRPFLKVAKQDPRITCLKTFNF